MTKLICEIGINHNGKYEIAKKICEELIDIKVWGVKFQYRNIKNYLNNASKSKEIGREIIDKELKKSHLTPSEIINLSKYLKKNNINCGISFFSSKDIIDFSNFEFDFYKIPSPVNNDIFLIKKLYKKKKQIILSFGARSHDEILKLKKLYKKNLINLKRFTFLHCVSNYPLNSINSNLAYIDKLKKIFNESKIGYSSHEEEIYNSILSLSKKVDFIERHVTMNKDMIGLDHSSSSNLKEIKQLNFYCKNYKEILFSNNLKTLNQGELINLQNLGKSYVYKKNLKKNQRLKKIYLEETYNNTANLLTIDHLIGKKLCVNVKKNEEIGEYQYNRQTKLKDKHLKFFRNSNISLPIRPRDYEKILQNFPLKNFEFHLSFEDVKNIKSFKLSSNLKNKKLSVHAPDYIDENNILDIFSKNLNIKKKSIKIIQDCVGFCKRLTYFTGTKTNLICSFSTKRQNLTNISYYQNLNDFIKKIHSKSKILILPQWLPPYAWYFGGSIKIEVFSNPKDLEMLQKIGIKICMDLSHFVLSCNYLKIRPQKYFYKNKTLFKHYHISDAKGVDGEGVLMGKGDLTKESFFKKIMINNKCNIPKVLETWRGHLNNFENFKKDLAFIYMYTKKN